MDRWCWGIGGGRGPRVVAVVICGHWGLQGRKRAPRGYGGGGGECWARFWGAPKTLFGFSGGVGTQPSYPKGRWTGCCSADSGALDGNIRGGLAVGIYESGVRVWRGRDHGGEPKGWVGRVGGGGGGRWWQAGLWAWGRGSVSVEYQGRTGVMALFGAPPVGVGRLPHAFGRVPLAGMWAIPKGGEWEGTQKRGWGRGARKLYQGRPPAEPWDHAVEGVGLGNKNSGVRVIRRLICFFRGVAGVTPK